MWARGDIEVIRLSYPTFPSDRYHRELAGACLICAIRTFVGIGRRIRLTP